jgi:hypothetical protein
LTYPLPTITDSDLDIVSILVSPNVSLYTFNGITNTFRIAPDLNNFGLVGLSTCTITLDDGKDKNTYQLEITVTNTGPIFITAPLSTMPDMFIGETSQLNLPAISDLEGHTWKLTVTPNDFAKVNAENTILTVFTTNYAYLHL